jgi:hypothetical protein
MADQKQAIKSSVLKCGKRTFFFDIYPTSNGSRYLKVTESSLVGESNERKRNTFLMFQKDAQDFQTRLSEMVSEL